MRNDQETCLQFLKAVRLTVSFHGVSLIVVIEVILWVCDQSGGDAV